MVDFDELKPVGVDTWNMVDFDWDANTDPFGAFDYVLPDSVNWISTVPVYHKNKYRDLFHDVIFELVDRTDVFLSARIGFRDTESGHFVWIKEYDRLKAQVKECLDRLSIDFFDAIFLFRNHFDESNFDPAHCHELKQEGLLRYLGLIDTANSDAHDVPITEQFDCLLLPHNPFTQVENFDEVSPTDQNETRILTYDPLYGGLLSEDYTSVNPSDVEYEVRKFHPKFTQERINYIGCTQEIDRLLKDNHYDVQLETLMYNWSCMTPPVTGLKTSVRNVKDALTVVESLDIELTESEYETVQEIAGEYSTQGGDPEFISPPPVLPRHNFEKHVFNTNKSDEQISLNVSG